MFVVIFHHSCTIKLSLAWHTQRKFLPSPLTSISQVYEKGRNLASHQAVSSHHETVKYQSEQLEQFMGTLSSVENDVVDLIRSNKNSSLPQEVRCPDVDRYHWENNTAFCLIIFRVFYQMRRKPSKGNFISLYFPGSNKDPAPVRVVEWAGSACFGKRAEDKADATTFAAVRRLL